MIVPDFRPNKENPRGFMGYTRLEINFQSYFIFLTIYSECACGEMVEGSE